MRADKREALGEVVRLIVEWVLPQLRESDSLAALTRGLLGRNYYRRVAEELQDELHSRLDVIFKHCSEGELEELKVFLRKFAGKYGDEK